MWMAGFYAILRQPVGRRIKDVARVRKSRQTDVREMHVKEGERGETERTHTHMHSFRHSANGTESGVASAGWRRHSDPRFAFSRKFLPPLPRSVESEPHCLSA